MTYRLLRFSASCSAVVGVLLLGLIPVATAQVQHETSEITGIERVSSTRLQDTNVQNYAGSDIAYKVEYTYQPETADESWTVTFYGFSDRPTDMSSADRVLTWMNGQRRRLDSTSRMRRLDNEVTEIQTVSLSASLFQRMATAETVQLTIGSAEFDLSYENRADMRAAIQQASEIADPNVQQQRADNGNR